LKFWILELRVMLIWNIFWRLRKWGLKFLLLLWQEEKRVFGHLLLKVDRNGGVVFLELGFLQRYVQNWGQWIMADVFSGILYANYDRRD